jgi:hypothetical protein
MIPKSGYRFSDKIMLQQYVTGLLADGALATHSKHRR